MADVHSPQPVPQPSSGQREHTAAGPRGEHEAASHGQDVLVTPGNEAAPKDDTEPQPANGAAGLSSGDAALAKDAKNDGVVPEPPNAAKTKSTNLSVKSATGKSNGGPPSQLVKKVRVARAIKDLDPT